MNFKIILVFLLSFCSAQLFRLGGSAKNGSWLDFAKNTKARDAGCPLIALIALWLLVGFKSSSWWAYALTFGLSWGAMSTYFSYLVEPDDDVTAIEWFVTGLFYGLSAFPLVWAGVHWYAIIGRSIALGLAIMWLRIRTGKDFKEEKGSGFLYILSTFILKI